MRDLFEFDDKQNNVDFSQGRENAVWKKIVSRLRHDIEGVDFNELNNISGGFSNGRECNADLEEYWENINTIRER